ncbi:MAG: hypothetical protein ACSHXK_03305 [Oceanococcus sp.]
MSHANTGGTLGLCVKTSRIALLFCCAALWACNGGRAPITHSTPATPADCVNSAERSCAATEAERSLDSYSSLPLLGSSHGRFYAEDFCENQPDSAVLPQDPRELIVPGINARSAVTFNAFWQDCAGPGNNPLDKPKSCGEYRAQRDLGKQLMRGELVANQGGSFSSGAYNALWLRWGLSERPENFDQQVRERYGLPKAPYPNPYPLDGEDPNATQGGSGELPVGFIQGKTEDGQYSSNLLTTCDLCHSSGLDMLGENSEQRFVSGLGGHNLDYQLLLSDELVPTLPIAINSTRGVTNAMGLSGLLISLIDADNLNIQAVGTPIKLLGMQTPFNTTGGGDTKMPAWWNASHRPRKFWDAGYSYDAIRLDNVILQATLGGDVIRAQEALGQSTQTYLDSLEAPRYPGDVDTSLAEQGAILFHVKDLWAGDSNADLPRPPGNGSCASCHGAYSPRFVHDQNFLQDPRLAGIAGYIAPLEQIGTDSSRNKGFTSPLFELMSTSWFSYPEGSDGYVPIDGKDPITENLDDAGIFVPGTRIKGACTWQGVNDEDATGYLAPPLHGIWATAPYLHNGSVPDVWSLLQPTERPTMWRRQLTTGEGEEHGFATSWDAYDEQRMGWKHDVLYCDYDGSAVPYRSCEPAEVPAEITAITETLIRFPSTLNSVGYQTLPPIGRQGVEDRKIFNTHMFGKGNAGHDFGRALSAPQRRAVIEYLKTL